MMDLEIIETVAQAANSAWPTNMADYKFRAAVTPAVVLDMASMIRRLQSELTAERATIQRMTAAAYDDAEKVDRLEEAAKALGALTDDQIDAIYRKTNKINVPEDDYRYGAQLKQSRYDAARAFLALAPSIQALPVVAPSDSSMPVDMSQAKRWIVQLRARIDSLLAIINAPAAAQPEAKEAPAALSDAQIHAVIDSMGWFLDDTEREDMILLVRAALAAAGNSQDAKDAARFVFEHTNPEAMLPLEMAALSTELSIKNLDWWRAKIDAAMAAAPSPAEPT